MTTDTPSPHIWYIHPDHVMLNEQVTVVGTGFGSTINQYLGEVLLGAQQPPPVSWGEVPPGSNAYTSARSIDPTTDTADPEHGRVIFNAPPDAQSGNVVIVTEV